MLFFKLHELGTAAEADAARRVVPLLRTFTVFNAEQDDDLPPALTLVIEPCSTWDASEAADRILEESHARIRHGGARAFCMPSDPSSCRRTRRSRTRPTTTPRRSVS